MVYLDLVVALNFVVDFLLILGTNRLVGYPPGWKKAVFASLIGSVYAGWCLIPGFHFLGNALWRTVCLALLGVVAFGMNRGALQRTGVFVLLSMALGGLASGAGRNDFDVMVLCALVLWLLCRIGFRGSIGHREYVPVRLRHDDKEMCRIALRDTGNTLKDPLTGESVLVAGLDAAEELLGLSYDQLLNPVETVASGVLPGLRLIPYCSIGQPRGMLVAYRFREGRIGEKKAQPLVAFTPELIGKTDVYQMLAGGVI